jgi:hypothetical protein
MTTLPPSPPSAPEAGELARRLRQGIKQENGDRRFPTIIVTIKDAEQIIALLLKLAETEKQLAEAHAVIINSDWKVSVQLLHGARRVELAKWRKDAMVRIALRSAATSGKGE